MDDGVFSFSRELMKIRSERNVWRRKGALSEKECIMGNIHTLSSAEMKGQGRDRVF